MHATKRWHAISNRETLNYLITCTSIGLVCLVSYA